MNSKALARRWFNEVWNQKNPEVIHEMLRADALAHTEGGDLTGPDDFLKEMFVKLTTAFSDLRLDIDGGLEEGNEAVIRWTVTATHDGDLQEIKATGRKVRFSGMTWIRFDEGQIVEGWDRWNIDGLMTLLRTGVESATTRFLE